ncbi:MAG: hypothetical protein ACOY94_11950 [Bacillota bacterium]
MLLVAPGCGQPSADFDFEEVRYSITGGIAGFDRTMRIAPDGSYRVTDAGRARGSGRLAGESLNRLKELLAEVDWGAVEPSYIDRKVADSLHQTVSVRQERSEYITTVGTGGNPPQPVAALVAFLDEVLRKAR